MEAMYPRVRVRVATEEDLIDEQEEGKGGLDLVKGFDSPSLKGPSSPGKEFRNDSPPTIARVPKYYVPGLATPSVPLCKGAIKCKKVAEDSRPNIRASSVPRPRAVLSSPDNDGMIGKIKQLSQERSSLLKRQSPGANTPIHGRISSGCVKAKNPTNTRSSFKETTDSKSHLKGNPKSRVDSTKTAGIA